MKIEGKTVLITGGCSGIGKLMAIGCLEKKAGQVIIWDINEAAIAATVEELSAKGKVWGTRADISSPASIDAAAVATKAACPPVDILINNAGIITNNKFFWEQTDKDIDLTIDIDTKGAMYVALRFINDMRERGTGHICNIASAAGMLPIPRMSLYCGAKWGAIGWSDSVRIELEREKSPLKITTVAPYFINTGMFDGIRSVFKVQKPEVVAKKVLKGIERNRDFVGIPFGQHFIRFNQGIFPKGLFNVVFGDICGLYTVMDHFTGRVKK